MNRSLRNRLALDLALLVGVFLFPYWVVVLVAAAFALLVPYYVEFPLLVVLEEALYADRGLSLSHMALPLALLALFVLIELSRGAVRERFLRI